MRIVISGGSGLIGSALAGSLLADGNEVIVLSRYPEKASQLPEGVKVIAWDGVSAEGWGEWVEGADAVVNLAGASIAGENPLTMRWTAKRKEAILGSRINAGKAISEAVKSAKNKPGVVIQSSAVGLYGPLSNEYVDEDTPAGDDFLARVCKQWEDSTSEVETLGVRRVVIRTGLVFSNQGGVFPLLSLPFKYFMGGALGNGDQYLSWIHIADAVAAIRFLINQRQTQGVYNLTAPNPVPNKEFSEAMGNSMSRPSAVPIPSPVMKLALGEVSTLALDGQRARPARLLDAGFTFEYPHLDQALTALLHTNLHFIHRFTVDSPRQAVADFHRDTSTLKQLTPFPIIVQLHEVEPVTEGAVADFTFWLGPLPISWRVKHYDFDPPRGFKDIQLEGPFAFWDRRQTFVQIDGHKTEIIDTILARYGHGLFHNLVSRFIWLTLPILFSYRKWQTSRLLNNTR